jgi:5'-deoxy-5'-methylthioadenosine phosphorylase
VAQSPLGIIAGTGFRDLAALEAPRTDAVDTAYGLAQLTAGSWHGLPVVFLPRHGPGHTVPPHRVNYRANIRALADAGCRDVLAVNVTGGIDPQLKPGDLLVLDDFVDLTRGRIGTFFDGDGPEGVVHMDMSAAYDAALRRELLEAAAAAGITVRDGGVYACFDGPRFETPAEIQLALLAGADVVGMTGVPEVSLAVEAGLRYAALSLVVNPAAGVRPDETITMEQIDAVLAVSAPRVLAILDELVHTRAVFDATDGGAR